MTRGPSARRVGDARADRVRRRRCGDAVNTTGERQVVSCAACHRGHMCRGWGSRGHTLRGETSTTPVTHRCVRCGERDVHGVRHERARTWNVERWATTALSRDPAAPRRPVRPRRALRRPVRSALGGAPGRAPARHGRRLLVRGELTQLLLAQILAVWRLRLCRHRLCRHRLYRR